MFGLSIQQYDIMLIMQQERCDICRRERKPKKGKPLRPLNVDHDHKTGRVRGLLCFTCNNKLLARGCEVPEYHERAANYLRSAFGNAGTP